MSEWQPIETAPKDGTWILTVVAGFLPAVMSWQTHFGKSRWAGDPGDHETEECWKEGFLFSHYAPTHWMPLPAPPVPA